MMEKSNKARGRGSDSLAFTLAEVLITLAIIGVVAALTIPTVVRNYKKQETVTRLKKVYSALSNTTNLAIAEHGPIESWVITCSGGFHCANNFAKVYMIPYLKVAKDCYDASNTTKCDYPYYNLNSSTPRTWIAASYTTFYLNDGTFIRVWVGGLTNSMGLIYIDLNGPKKPNTFGKDMFVFDYYIQGNGVRNGKMLALGFTTDRSALTGNCSKNGDGTHCAALIMLDGWKMSDDYPW